MQTEEIVTSGGYSKSWIWHERFCPTAVCLQRTSAATKWFPLECWLGGSLVFCCLRWITFYSGRWLTCLLKYFFAGWGVPVACRSSPTRSQTQATAATMPDPYLLSTREFHCYFTLKQYGRLRGMLKGRQCLSKVGSATLPKSLACAGLPASLSSF